MKPFAIEKIFADGAVRYTLSGYVDELARFPKNKELSDKIIIDLSAVDGLNSLGTRNWCVWMELFRPPVKIELHSCPSLFVKAFNNVMGALPPNAKVLSFFVPYLSPDGKVGRKDVLFRLGTEYTDTGELRPPEVKTPEGVALEMDVMTTYFNFLKK